MQEPDEKEQLPPAEQKSLEEILGPLQFKAKVPVPDSEVSQSILFRAEYNRVVEMAKSIPDNKTFAHIIRQAQPLHRKAMYTLLAPHLSFKPLSYLSINSTRKRK